MPNVELWIEDYQIELQGDEIIATDYAIAEIGDFAARKSFRSINFDIPLTANNKRILENPDVFNNLSLRPYRRLKARVYQDGIDQQIRFADIESVQDAISMRLYGGNASFFDEIKALTIADLDLIDYDHYLDRATVVASRTNTTGYIYPIIDYHEDSPNIRINNTDQEIDIRYMFPALFIDHVLSLIATTAGYTLDNQLLTDADYATAELILPYSSGELIRNRDSRRYIQTVELVLTPPFNQVPVAGQPDPIGVTHTTVQGSNFYDITNLDSSFYFADSVDYTCEYRIEMTNAGAPSYIEFGTLDTVDSGITQLVVPFFTGTIPSGSVVLTGTFTRQVGTKPTNIASSILHVFNGNNQLTYEAGTYFKITEATIRRPGAITNVDTFHFNYVTLNSIWGTIKQSDFYKAYLQQYCAIIKINEDTKVVSIIKFDTLNDNIGNSLDWSDKIDYTEEPRIEFDLNKYAQNNSLSYKEDESVVKPQGTDYNLQIDDSTLEGEADLLSPLYAATENVERLNGVNISQIKMWTTNGAVTEITEDVTQRILLLNRVDAADIYASGGLTYKDASAFTTLVTTDIPVTWFVRSDKEYNLGFENNLVPLYWQTIINMLARVKIVVAQLRLNAIDINSLDFFTPVYLRQYNSHFYISKIKNYRYGSTESTSVELVKLR